MPETEEPHSQLECHRRGIETRAGDIRLSKIREQLTWTSMNLRVI